jgi:hypothetical protein
MLHDVLREGIKSSANSAFAVAMVLGYGYTVLKFIGYPFIVLVGIYFPTVGCGLRCAFAFSTGVVAIDSVVHGNDVAVVLVDAIGTA